MPTTKGRNFMTADDEIEKLNQKLYDQAHEHNEKIKDSMMVATAYIAVGTKILRTLLDDTNYRKFMDHISDEDVVKPFKKHTVH